MASNISALMGSLASAVKEQRRQHVLHARNAIEKELRRLALLLASASAPVCVSDFVVILFTLLSCLSLDLLSVALSLQHSALFHCFASLLSDLQRWSSRPNETTLIEAVTTAAAALHKV